MKTIYWSRSLYRYRLFIVFILFFLNKHLQIVNLSAVSLLLFANIHPEPKSDISLTFSSSGIWNWLEWKRWFWVEEAVARVMMVVGVGVGWGWRRSGQCYFVMPNVRQNTQTTHSATSLCVSDVVVLDVLIYALYFILPPKKTANRAHVYNPGMISCCCYLVHKKNPQKTKKTNINYDYLLSMLRSRFHKDHCLASWFFISVLLTKLNIFSLIQNMFWIKLFSRTTINRMFPFQFNGCTEQVSVFLSISGHFGGGSCRVHPNGSVAISWTCF